MVALVIGMLDAVGKEFKTDKNRLYITGLSLGGFGTFGTVSARPDLFAAAAPVCGGWPGAKGVKGMAAVPFWIFHGGADNVVPAMLSKSIADALKAAGGTVKHTEYPGVGHNSWTRAYNTPELWEWLFAQKKKSAGRK
jgi:predicted peptidase